MSSEWAAAYEHAARQFEPPERRWATPGELAAMLDPRTRNTPALQLLDTELKRLIDTPDGRLIVSMAPQEGKSVRAANVFPTWALTENPDLRVVAASYGQSLANRNGRAIRRHFTTHSELGYRIAPDNGAVHEWTLAGHEGGVLAVGVGAGVTGRPADLLVIDDPIKDRAEADSERYRDAVWDWWTDAASARLAPGAPVLLILTRWHHDDLAARLLKHDADAGWRVLNIPAQCVDPATDPLGRQYVGEYMESARGRTLAQWEQRRKTAGPATWEALYQGNPTPRSGNLFHRGWWQRYDVPLWQVLGNGVHHLPGMARQDAELMQSWDMTFKDTQGTDYVVGQVWLRRGADAYLLDQVRGQWAFTETVAQFKALTAKWPQALLKLVEDKANGPAVISALRRQIPGIVAEEPHGSKYARAEAVSPLVQAQNVWVPDTITPDGEPFAPWAEGFITEHAEFPSGSHDDQVDGTSQALTRLFLDPVLEDDTYTPEDLGLLESGTGYLRGIG